MKPFQGFIPAAGLGTRLRPFTLKVPKPLIPFGPKTPLYLAMQRLTQAGCSSLAVNSHHLADQIRQAVSGYARDLKVSATVSFEPQLLGTLGFFSLLKGWLGDGDIVIYNSDIISDMDIKAAVLAHQQSGALATMVLLDELRPGKTVIYTRENGRVKSIGGAASSDAPVKANFSGVHILSPDFAKRIPKDGPLDMVETYRAALSNGEEIGSFYHRGFWHDIGDPPSLFEAYDDIFFRKSSEEKQRRLGFDQAGKNAFVYAKAGETIEVGGATLSNKSFVTDKTCLSKGSSLSRSIIFPDAVINEGEQIDSLIIGYGERLLISQRS